MPRNRLYLVVMIVLLSVLQACNLPDNAAGPGQGEAVYTQAALTVQAQLTGVAQTQAAGAGGAQAGDQGATEESAPAMPTPTATLPEPPTSTPITPSPTSTQTCDKAEFVSDVTVADGTQFSADDTFTKTWRIRNTGTCSWTPSYTFHFNNGDQMSGPSSIGLTGNVNPGQTVDISVNLKAPSSNGNYTGYWKLRNAAGVDFFTVYVKIKVGGGGGSSGGVFAVIHVNFSTTTWNSPGFVNCPQVNAEIVVNKAGTVEYHWVRSDGPSTSGTLTFAAAGSQVVSAKWSLGSVWLGNGDWMGIYIDSPNHQDFGHIGVTPCTTP